MASDRDTDVPDPDHPRIVASEMFGGEPHIRNRWITVLDVYDQVKSGESKLPPDEFAKMFELSVADVYVALAYYCAHEEEMEDQREAREQASAEFRK